MLEELAAALAATGYKFAHFGWSKAPAGDYGIYAEDGANDLIAGDHHAEKALEGTVDYFTRDDTGEAQSVIETALDGIVCAWYLESVQFEDDTGYIHYEWVWQLPVTPVLGRQPIVGTAQADRAVLGA